MGKKNAVFTMKVHKQLVYVLPRSKLARERSSLFCVKSVVAVVIGRFVEFRVAKAQQIHSQHYLIALFIKRLASLDTTHNYWKKVEQNKKGEKLSKRSMVISMPVAWVLIHLRWRRFVMSGAFNLVQSNTATGH